MFLVYRNHFVPYLRAIPISQHDRKPAVPARRPRRRLTTAAPSGTAIGAPIVAGLGAARRKRSLPQLKF
jgi:hypothetical protein